MALFTPVCFNCNCHSIFAKISTAWVHYPELWHKSSVICSGFKCIHVKTIRLRLLLWASLPLTANQIPHMRMDELFWAQLVYIIKYSNQIICKSKQQQQKRNTEKSARAAKEEVEQKKNKKNERKTQYNTKFTFFIKSPNVLIQCFVIIFFSFLKRFNSVVSSYLILASQTIAIVNSAINIYCYFESVKANNEHFTDIFYLFLA